MSEKFKEEKIMPDVEIPPISQETLEKIEKKIEVLSLSKEAAEKITEKSETPPPSQETLEKLAEKPEIPPLSEETIEKIEKKIEIPPISKKIIEKLTEKTEIPPLSKETLEKIGYKEESFFSMSAPEAESPPQQILDYIKEKAKSITETGAKTRIKIGGKILNLFLFGVAAMALLFVGGTWYFLKGFKSLVKKSIEQITGEKFEKKDKK